MSKRPELLFRSQQKEDDLLFERSEYAHRIGAQHSLSDWPTKRAGKSRLVHNGTSNLAKDLVRLAQANFGKRVYPAAEEEAELLEGDLLSGKPAVILCHSAGCAQVNESIADLRDFLREQTNPSTGQPFTDQEISALERSKEVRLDYGPANTRLEKGPYSRITVRKKDVAGPLHWAKGQYDQQVSLPELARPSGFFRNIPGVSHALDRLDAHNFDKSYEDVAAQDILEQSKRNEMGFLSLV